MPAPDARAAAQIYPAAYWLSLMEIPKGAMPEREVLSAVKECLTCHQLGNQATREISKALGSFPNALAAWDHRVTVGPMGLAMSGSFQRFGEQRRMFAEWTDRIAAGAVPKQAPPRPSGLERNLVVTLWDWAVPTGGRSDGAASDDRIGSNNANGPVWGVIQSDDLLVSIDPAANQGGADRHPDQRSDDWRATRCRRRISRRRRSGSGSRIRAASRSITGARVVDGPHSRGAEAAPFCKPGSTNKFTSYFPVPRLGARQVMVYDPKTKQFAQIDTCFDADHNHFAENAEQTLYFGQNNTLGWVDTAVYDKTKNAEASQGWCPAVVDTTGDGKITQWTEPEQPPDPAKDRRVTFGCYSVSVNEKDGGIWCAGIGPRDNKLVRIERGPDPPLTCKAEVFEPPPGHTPEVFRSGGVSVDSKGIVWLNWRGTDYFTSFDRSKCKTLNGPQATGQHCPEGWTVHIGSRPDVREHDSPANTPNNSDLLYLTHVDRHDTLGLGPDVPVSGSVNTDSLLAFVPRTNQFVQLTVPYPMGFFARSAQGRIDNPRTGWKGRGF